MGFRLVVFDVDGTLTRHSSIWWRLHEHFGTVEGGRKLYDQFFAGEITYQQWAYYDALLWTDKPLSEVMEVVEKTELVTGAVETVETLKEQGLKVAILSGGVDLMANDIASRLGIDYVVTNRLLHSNGLLTGKVEVLFGWGEKPTMIRRVTEHFGVSLDETVYVGDGLNDVSVFSEVGLSIAFMPEHEDVAEAATVTIRDDDLRFILPHILSEAL
ncbi:MAG: HAD family phosphatase [Candidatus Thorarchaeota archaeon]|nr:MAG: HAD family phosphatase [Candidatus Thorarchaeota archaeon]